MTTNNTSFSEVYDSFLSKVTDDMYMEMFPEEVQDILKDLLINAIPFFEFPKVDISSYNIDVATFNTVLSQEEINILATYMLVGWMSQQLATVDNIRMKYSGQDFKFTSQAAHMKAISGIRDTYLKEGIHLQRLYNRRRKNAEGKIVSSFDSLMEMR